MISPSNAQRRVLRNAISAHPDWPAYRAAQSCGDTSTLSGARCVEICAALSLDPAAILFGAAPADPAPADPAPAAIPVAPAGLFNGRAPAPSPAPAAAPAPSPAPAAAPADLGAALAMIAQAIENPAPAVDLDSALAPIHAALDQARADITDLQSAAPALLVVDRDGHPFGAELPPQRHPQLETLLRSISARDVSAARLNVWIAGPAGSGKTHAAKQCAQALDLDFGFHGAMTYAHDLVGFVDAAGRYHETQFVKLYREGGLCLLDELDSGTSEALLTLNAALANGQISIPSGEIISRHPDFACIGAANTFGAGATAEYVGRNKLDAAFLSRFPVKIAWNYDLDLEAAICGNADWAQEVQAARAKAQAAGLKIVIDPRHSIAGAALIAAGMDRAQVAELTYLAGLKPEQVAMLKGGKK